MTFWKRFSRNRSEPDPPAKTRINHITCDDLPVLDGNGTAAQDGQLVVFGIHLTQGFKGANLEIPQTLRLTRSDAETAKLVEGFRPLPTDGAIDFDDIVIRNQTRLEPSTVRIVDTKVYDIKDRLDTGDWFFRREIHLSQATYDRLWSVLEAQYPTPTGSARLASATLTIDGISHEAVECDPHYSGSVVRKRFDVTSLRLGPVSGYCSDARAWQLLETVTTGS